jgi:PEGA domain-containing protein
MTRPNSLAVDTAAEETPRPLASWYAEGSSDGVGDRLLMFDNSGTPSLELLRFRRDLAAAPGFEDALRARVDRLQGFTHPAFPRVRAVEHLDAGGDLTLVSTYTPGKRLSEVFRSPRARAGVHPAFAAWLIRDLTSALADLQRHGRGVIHGALTADRIVLTGDGRLMLTEHAIGGALVRLRLPAARLWDDFGLIAPEAHDGTALLDERSDVIQLAWIVLSVLLGRRITRAEHPYATELFDEFARTSGRRSPGLVPSLRCWLERALRSDEHAFKNASDAQVALRELGIHAAPHEIQPVPDIQPTAPVQPTAPYEASGIAAVDAPPAPEVTAANPEPTPLLEPENHAMAMGTDYVADLYTRTLDRAAIRDGAGIGGRVALGWIAAGVFALCAIVEAGIIARLATRSSLIAPVAVPVTFDSREPGDAVIVDGKQVGVTPLEIGLTPAVRSVRVEAQLPTGESAVKVAAQSLPVDRSPDAAAIAQAAVRERRGGLRVSSPVEVQVLEGERVLGSSVDGPIVTTAGRHELDFVNSAIGYRSHVVVDLKPGQILKMKVVPPDGRVSVNAIPWAQVWINGNLVGDTPIANLPLAPGEHQITFRHPQLGEQTQKVIVRAAALTRVSATFAR